MSTWQCWWNNLLDWSLIQHCQLSGLMAEGDYKMGFFSSATFSDGSSQFEAAVAGSYVCRLANVESIDRPSYDDPNVMLPNFKFTFETTEYGDSNSNAFRFVKFTRQGYGSDKAALTILLDGMLGRRLTSSEFHNLDIDSLLAKEWMVTVDAKLNTRGYQHERHHQRLSCHCKEKAHEDRAACHQD